MNLGSGLLLSPDVDQVIFLGLSTLGFEFSEK